MKVSGGVLFEFTTEDPRPSGSEFFIGDFLRPSLIAFTAH
jgi:hypothetical protein